MADSPVARYFASTLAEHGSGPLAVSWKGMHSQLLGFYEMLELGQLDGCRVLDVGCGLGALWPFLQGFASGVVYTGIDICPDMIAAARTCHPDATFEVHDITEKPFDGTFDWVFAAGIFNLTELPYRAQQARVRAGLKNLFLSARSGVACNFLSQARYTSAIFRHEAGLRFHYEDPGAVLTHALKLTPHVKLKHATVDENAFTVYLYSGVADVVREIYEELPTGQDLESRKRRLLSLSRLDRMPEIAAWLEELPEGPDRTYLEALYHSHNHDFDKALDSFAAAQEAHDEAIEDRATLLMYTGRADEMVALLEEGITDRSETCQERYVNACLRLGMIERATTCVESMPEGGLRALLEGRLCEARRDAPGALRAFRRAYQHAPYSAAVVERLYRLCQAQQRGVEAIVWMHRLRELRPGDPALEADRERLLQLFLQAEEDRDAGLDRAPSAP